MGTIGSKITANGKPYHQPTTPAPLALEHTIEPVLNAGQVAQTLHRLMEEVTKETVNAETVGAACQCAARLTDLVRVCIEAAKLQRSQK